MAPCHARNRSSFRSPLHLRLVLRPVSGLLLVAALALALLACDAVGPVNEPPPEPPTEPAALATLLADNGNFETYAELVASASGAINTGSGTTHLAPDDEAFSLLGPETLAGLRRQPATLSRLLARHLVTTRVDPATLADGDLLPTLEGTPIRVRIDDEGTVFLGEARLEGVVGQTPDGPVLRLSRVLRDHLTVAERLRASPLLSRSLAYFEAAGVDLSLPGTYFIPIDAAYNEAPGGAAAFASQPNSALVRKTLRALYVPGAPLTEAELRAQGSVETAQGTTLDVSVDGGVTRLSRGESRILVADLEARGAVIHLIGPPPQGHLTLQERIAFLPTLSSFASLLQQAGLAETLSGAGPYTVFAPIQAAFDSLGTRGQTTLLTDTGLARLLGRFHVSPTDVSSEALVAGASFPTLSDQTIEIRPDPRTGESRVSRAAPTSFLDLPASNGRLHLMQSLLNPDLVPYDQLRPFRLFRLSSGCRDCWLP